MILIIASIRTHTILIAGVLIVIHEIVCGQSYDPAEEMTSPLVIINAVRNTGDIIVERLVCVDGEAR